MAGRPKYYRVLDDLKFPARWHLEAPVDGAGREVDPWQFTDGKLLEVRSDLSVPVRHAGVTLDFTFAAFDVPVVTPRAQSAIMSAAASDIQLLPVAVDQADTAGGPFAILNATRLIPCLDESRSEFMKWTKADRRPDRVGKYRMVTRLRIESEKVTADVFRIAGWEVALIVSDNVREAMRAASITGVRFEAV